MELHLSLYHTALSAYLADTEPQQCVDALRSDRRTAVAPFLLSGNPIRPVTRVTELGKVSMEIEAESKYETSSSNAQS